VAYNVGYRRTGRKTAILPPPKVVRCLKPLTTPILPLPLATPLGYNELYTYDEYEQSVEIMLKPRSLLVKFIILIDTIKAYKQSVISYCLAIIYKACKFHCNLQQHLLV